MILDKLKRVIPIILIILLASGIPCAQATGSQAEKALAEKNITIQPPAGEIDKPIAQLLLRMEDNLASLNLFSHNYSKRSDIINTAIDAHFLRQLNDSIP